jgi:hypothetical protein
MSMKRNECKRQCRYNYTKAERLEKGRALADEYGTLDGVNADLERVKKDFKARIETHESKIQSLAEQVRSGYELRDTLCFYTYNEPKPGRKTLRRADTFEVIGEEDMTGADTQLVMEAVDAEAAQAAKPLAIQVADLPVEPWPSPIESITVVDSPVAQAFGSAKFAPVDSTLFAGWLRSIYYPEADGAPHNDPTAASQVVAGLVVAEAEIDMIRFLEWLEERARPGGKLIISILRNDHGILTPGPDDAVAKKKRTGKRDRRSSGPGTVDLPSDEGSRDDAGDDSKNNL